MACTYPKWGSVRLRASRAPSREDGHSEAAAGGAHEDLPFACFDSCGYHDVGTQPHAVNSASNWRLSLGEHPDA